MIKLKYPLDPFDGDFDYIKISSVRYTPSTNSARNPLNVGTGDASNRNTTASTIIFLPMPTNITDSNSSNWDADRLNGIDAAFLYAAQDAVNDGKPAEGENILDTAKRVVGGIGDNVTKFSQSLVGENKKQTKNYLIAQAISQFRNVNAAAVVARASGKVLNPNLELLYQSPDLRTFGFQFDLTPRTSAEGASIKAIIKTLKRDSAAKKGEDGLFITTPNVFKIEYMRGRRGHPFLNKFKICALKNITTDYTSGTGGYKAYEDSTPVKLSMSLSFTELSQIFNSDFDDVDGVGY